MELQWPLIVFTLFVCISTGTLATVSIAAAREGYGATERPALAVSFVCAVVGGLASVFHLETPTRYFGQFGNLSSGINHEIIGLALLCLMIAIYFVQLRRHGHVHVVVRVLSVLASVLLVYMMADSYMMASKPAWNTFLLPVYYLANAAVLGLVCFAVIAHVCKIGSAEQKTLNGAALVALGVFVFAVGCYAVFLGRLDASVYSVSLYLDATMHQTLIDPTLTGQRLFVGDLALLFWGGIVVVGLACPAAALVIARKKPAVSFGGNVAALVCLLAGNVAFRAVLYVVGATLLVY